MNIGNLSNESSAFYLKFSFVEMTRIFLHKNRTNKCLNECV